MKRLTIGFAVAFTAFSVASGAFNYLSEISISKYAGGELTDFPLLVRVSPTIIQDFAYSQCRADGADIRFYAADGVTPLASEIDTWNTSGESLFWVRVPSFTSSTKLLMKYGNAALTEAPDGTNVWKAAAGGFYGGVWHFNDTVAAGTESAKDAAKRLDTLSMDAISKQGANGNASEMMSCAGAVGMARVNSATTATGASAKSQTGNYFLVPNYDALSIGSSFTISLWAKTDLTSPGGLMSRKGVYSSAGGFGFNYSGASTMFMRFGGSSSATYSGMPKLSEGWTHLLIVCNDTTFIVYGNGALVGTKPGTAAADNGTALSIGSIAYDYSFTGSLDEIRLLDAAVSGDWAAAEYAAVADTGFLSYGQATALGNAFVVTAAPEKWGTVTPAYGAYTNYTQGQEVALSADDAPFAVADDLKARFAGWKLYEADEHDVFTQADESDENSFDYVHVYGSNHKFVWQLKRIWRLTLATSGLGEADFFINGNAAVVGDNWIEETNAVVVAVVPRTGSRFFLWDEDKVATATRTNDLSAAMTLTAKVLAADELASDSYVKDGLVLQFDGLENAARGVHATSATVWQDLVGGRTLQMPTSAFTWTWDANSWNITAAGDVTAGGPSLDAFDVNWNAMTFEACAAQAVATHGNYLFWGACSDGSTAKFSTAKDGTGSKASFTYPGASAFSLSGRVEGTHVATVRDGVARVWQPPDKGATATVTSPKGTLPTTFHLFCANTYYNDRYVGHVYGVRLYNRALTDHELRWNAFVDQARYLDPDVLESGNTLLYIEALPLSLGIVPTGAGETAFVKGTTVTSSIDDKLVTHPFDSARVADLSLGTGVRARYTGYTLCEALDAPTTVAAAESATNALSAQTATLSWNFEKEYDFVANAIFGGKVSVNGGAVTTAFETWVPATNAAARLTAVPDTGYAFFSWKGDLSGVAVATNATIDVVLTAPRTLQAIFVPTGEGHVPVENSWRGTVTSGNWYDGANWSQGEQPSIGDTVYLTNSVATAVAIEQPIDVAELVIGGRTTLTVANWFSCLKATKIRIRNGGTLKVTGGFTETQMSNRVWLAGTDLTIEKGGKIDAAQGGYGINQGLSWILARAAGTVSLSSSPSYGGKGQLPTYGSLAYPTDPGSGAYARKGGGAVLLDFTGTVTIDGEIDANGAAGNSGYAQPGSTGGAVLIKCAKITGSGTVFAGCSVYGSRVFSHGLPTYCGGGGRIAVHYDPAAQATTNCTVAFRAPGGILAMPTTPSREDPVCAGVGTLYFTDNRFLTGEDYRDGGWNFTGSWHSGEPLPSPLVLAGDRTLVKSRFEIPQEGLDLRVAGNLSLVGSSYFGNIETGLVLGENASLAVGGDLLVAGSRLDLGEGGSVHAAGSLLQRTNETALLSHSSCRNIAWNGGAVVLRAGATNEIESVGAEINVAGDWTVCTNAVVFPWCQSTNGAIVNLKARNFRLEKGGRVSADERGYERGYGPGIPALTTSLVGASHGGRGAANDAATSNLIGSVYGSAEHPLLPGSGGSLSSTLGYSGGGVVFLDIARKAEIYGELSANAVTNRSQSAVSGGSGGSVYVKAKKLVMDGTHVSVIGGSATKAVGGGGRLAFWATTLTTNGVTTAVRGGFPPSSAEFAEPGTVFWGTIPPLGVSVILR